MQIQHRPLALLLCCAVAARAQGNSFDKTRYNCGSVDSKVDPKDWHNQLTVTSDMISLALKDGKKLEIPPKTVTSLRPSAQEWKQEGILRDSFSLVKGLAHAAPYSRLRQCHKLMQKSELEDQERCVMSELAWKMHFFAFGLLRATTETPGPMV
jgi:hypothetical protein